MGKITVDKYLGLLAADVELTGKAGDK